MLHAFVADPLGYERLLNALAEITGAEIIRTHLVLNVLKRSPRFPLHGTGTRPPMGTALSTIGDSAPDRDANSASHPRAAFEWLPAGDQDDTVPRRCLDELDRRILRTLLHDVARRAEEDWGASGTHVPSGECLEEALTG